MKTRIIAHRGASHDAPENTLAAYRLAWAQGADGIEGDFRLTADGVIIACHDPTTKRTGDRALEVRTSAFADLRKVDVGAWKGEAWRGERMPSIDEALGAVPPGKLFYIEIYRPQTVPLLKQAIARARLDPAQLVVISFDRPTVAVAKQAMPEVRAFWIVNLETDRETGTVTPALSDLLAGLRACGANGLDCSAHERVDAAFVRAIKAAGFAFHVWTVDDPETARRFRDCGADSITTNRPRHLRDRLGD